MPGSPAARPTCPLILLVVAACAGPARPLHPGADRAALFAADSAFDDSTARAGADGWAAFFAANGVMFPPTGRVDGREEIRVAMAESFAPGAPALRWRPVEAEVGSGGDLGYTLGRWRSIATLADGRDSVLAEGNYVTIWRREADGAWRVAVDIGNRDRRD